VTHLRRIMLEELQGRKSLRLFLARLRIRWCDVIAEAPELPNHSPRTQLLRSPGDRWATFLVTDSSVEDQPDEPTVPMGNGSDGLIVSQAGDGATIHNLEDASFGPGCSIRRLIEYAPHLTVALWRAVAVVHACGLIVARTGTDPRGETFRGGKGCCGRADFCNDLLGRVHSQTGYFCQSLNGILVLAQQTGHFPI